MTDERLIINVTCIYVLLSSTVLDHMVITAIIKEGRVWVFVRGVNDIRSIAIIYVKIILHIGILIGMSYSNNITNFNVK